MLTLNLEQLEEKSGGDLQSFLQLIAQYEWNNCNKISQDKETNTKTVNERTQELLSSAQEYGDESDRNQFIKNVVEEDNSKDETPSASEEEEEETGFGQMMQIFGGNVMDNHAIESDSSDDGDDDCNNDCRVTCIDEPDRPLPQDSSCCHCSLNTLSSTSPKSQK